MAAGLGAKTLQEYLVSLGVKLDEKGMSKMEGFLKSSKMGFLALTGIMVTAATVATKWVKQVNEAELAFEKEAKAQKKSIETIRASENALKAMGKTKQEVAKDKSLKAVYDDLVAMNKAMALPDGSRGLALVRSISQEFLKFKSTIQYAMQWVNYHIISKLEGPLTRIRDTMKAWRERLQIEMPMWTAKIADGIAVFVRLLDTAVIAGGKVLKFLNDLPDGVKVAGTAIAGLWSIIRAGPLGWLLGGLTAILLLLDDYWTWMKHDPNQPSALSGLWEGLEDGTIGERLTSAVENGINSLTKWIDEHEAEIAAVGETLGNIIAGALNIAGMIADALMDDAVLAAALELGKSILGGIEEGITLMANKIFMAIMDLLPQAVQDALGWEKGMGWKIPEPEPDKNAFVGDGDNPLGTTVNPGEIIAADKQYPGVAYRNVGDKFVPEYAPEYERFMDKNNIPQFAKDNLAAALAQYESGGDPYLPGKGESYERLDDGGLTPEVRAIQREILAALKSGDVGPLALLPGMVELQKIFTTEKEALDNGKSYQALFEERIQAALDGMMRDKSGWYENYQNGHLWPFTPPYDNGRWDMWQKGLTEKGVSTEAQVQYDATQVTQATKEAVDVAQGATKPITIPANIVVDDPFQQSASPAGGGAFYLTRNALGGRYDKPVASTLAEDNEPEYVIPIKKLNRAIPLIRMMLSEIGEKGRQMLSDFGITPDTDIEALVASKGLGRPGGGSPIINVVNNYNYTNTVNAPSTFNINGSGNDPQAIGQAAYNAQERNLVRTLKAVIE